MYDGKRAGSTKDFYAEINRDNRYYVFGSWADLDAFRKSGSASGLSSAPVNGPNGETVMVSQPADALVARFQTLHAK